MKQRLEHPHPEIIPLAVRQDTGGNDILGMVERYWKRLQDSAPEQRAHLDPRGFGRALSHSFIADPVSDRSLRLRVAGQTIETLAGGPLRGVPLSLLFLPEARPALERATAQVLEGLPVRLALSAPRGPLRANLRGGLVLLPLSAGPDRPGRVLGALSTDAEPGRRPCRFRIQSPEKTQPAPGRPMLRVITGGLAPAP